MKYFLFFLIIVVLFFGPGINSSIAQPELTARGNLKGIRIDGQLMKFTTSMCLVGHSIAEVKESGRDDQRQNYTRQGDTQSVTNEISKFEFSETVLDEGGGTAKIGIKVKTAADTVLTGVFLCFDLPADGYSGSRIHLIDSAASAIDTVFPFPGSRGRMPGAFRLKNFLVQASAKGFRVQSAARTLEVRTEQPAEIIIQKGNQRFGNADDRIYISIMTGHSKDGQIGNAAFLIKASGEIDRTPAEITIDTHKPGRKFDGIGGNFRLQNEEFDPEVIDYCLDKLNVQWARVEMPWHNWHPVESINPLEAARAGKIDEGVRRAMEMARTLAKKHIPVILSAWSTPPWAIIGETNYRNENGIWGNPLNPKKMRSIIKSLGDYFVYLKEAYGVEPELFSFNESDLGINVRMTGQEHADFIKKLGAYLASKDVTTKMLLGDNSNATTIDFIQPALEDPAAHKYIGAISFHAWMGCDNWTLSNWADASRELNVPLIIAEGGIDPSAWGYPDILHEPSFAQDEIDTYIRSINTAHVRTILQWQLTSDYSLLTGGGIYRTEGNLHPTQRFWNLKQLGMVSQGSFILPVTCDKEVIDCAAFGDIAGGNYVIHIVNNGASRTIHLSGLPGSMKELRVYVTDSKRGMEESKRVHVSEDGEAKFTIDGFAFTSVVSAN